MAECRSCGAEIMWVYSAAGRLMALDVVPAERPRGLFRLDESGPDSVAVSCAGELVYLSHHVTCEAEAEPAS